jgi:hypothetical protein
MEWRQEQFGTSSDGTIAASLPQLSSTLPIAHGTRHLGKGYRRRRRVVQPTSTLPGFRLIVSAYLLQKHRRDSK